MPPRADTQTFPATLLTAGQSTISVTNNGATPTLNLGSFGSATTYTNVAVGATLEISQREHRYNNHHRAGYQRVARQQSRDQQHRRVRDVRLTDWATTDTTAGALGTGTATINGIGNLTTNGYVTTFPGTGQGANTDLTSNYINTGNTGTTTVRFNTPAATTINVNGKWQVISGVLITPNMGAVNTGIIGGNWYGNYSTTAASNVYIWQNNTAGFFVNSGGIVNDRSSNTGPNGATTTYIQSGPGTVLQGPPTGAGTLNGYSGQDYLNGGFDVVFNNYGLGFSGSAAVVNLDGGTVVGTGGSFSLDNGGGTSPRPFTMLTDGGGIAATAGNTLTIDGVISGAAGTGALTIGIPALASNGNTAGLLPGTGASTANTTGTYGTGTVVLASTGGNTFTGGVKIVGGATLNINSEYQLGGSNYGGIAFNNGTLQYATTLLNATTDISQNSAATPVAQKVTFTGNATIDTNGHAVTYANSIGNEGTGSLTVASTTAGGSLTLSGNNTFTGGINVNSGATLNLNGTNTNGGTSAINGTLVMNSGATMGNSAVTVASGASMTVKGDTIGRRGRP